MRLLGFGLRNSSALYRSFVFDLAVVFNHEYLIHLDKNVPASIHNFFFYGEMVDHAWLDVVVARCFVLLTIIQSIQTV